MLALEPTAVLSAGLSAAVLYADAATASPSSEAPSTVSPELGCLLLPFAGCDSESGEDGESPAPRVLLAAAMNTGPILGLFGDGVNASPDCEPGSSACTGGNGGLIFGNGGNGANGGNGGNAGFLFGNGGQGGDGFGCCLVLSYGGNGGNGGFLFGNGGDGGLSGGNGGKAGLLAGDGGNGRDGQNALYPNLQSASAAIEGGDGGDGGFFFGSGGNAGNGGSDIDCRNFKGCASSGRDGGQGGNSGILTGNGGNGGNGGDAESSTTRPGIPGLGGPGGNGSFFGGQPGEPGLNGIAIEPGGGISAARSGVRASASTEANSDSRLSEHQTRQGNRTKREEIERGNRPSPNEETSRHPRRPGSTVTRNG